MKEIARYPNGFEQNCTNVTAEYAERADGKSRRIASKKQFGRQER
jgi:lipocalin